MPESMIAAISSEVPTGRRMKGSETFIAPFYRRARALPAAGARYWLLLRGVCERWPFGFCPPRRP